MRCRPDQSRTQARQRGERALSGGGSANPIGFVAVFVLVQPWGLPASFRMEVRACAASPPYHHTSLPIHCCCCELGKLRAGQANVRTAGPTNQPQARMSLWLQRVLRPSPSPSRARRSRNIKASSRLRQAVPSRSISWTDSVVACRRERQCPCGLSVVRGMVAGPFGYLALALLALSGLPEAFWEVQVPGV